MMMRILGKIFPSLNRYKTNPMVLGWALCDTVYISDEDRKQISDLFDGDILKIIVFEEELLILRVFTIIFAISWTIEDLYKDKNIDYGEKVWRLAIDSFNQQLQEKMAKCLTAIDVKAYIEKINEATASYFEAAAQNSRFDGAFIGAIGQTFCNRCKFVDTSDSIKFLMDSSTRFSNHFKTASDVIRSRKFIYDLDADIDPRLKSNHFYYDTHGADFTECMRKHLIFEKYSQASPLNDKADIFSNLDIVSPFYGIGKITSMKAVDSVKLGKVTALNVVFQNDLQKELILEFAKLRKL